MSSRPASRNDRASDGSAAPVQFVTDESGGVTVLVDGHPQSYVDLADPEHLAFEYIAQMAFALDTLCPSGPLRVTHVGGAGLTLARYLAHTRPGSAQIVLEPDQATTDAVRRELPLPRGHRIRVRAVDGAAGVLALADSSADVVVLDAYAEGRVPAELGAVDFLGQVARVLRPDGLFLANVADEPARGYVRRFAAGCLAVGLSRVSLLATHDVAKGRRFGNTVLVAGAAEYDVDSLRRAGARCLFPTSVRGGAEVTGWLGGARAFTAADAERSPVPPQYGSWRAR